ncbi:MAG: hypothetical protein P4L33_00220 [Capsulimonadaceae bacterium]|nr:hypothetical protein [Capsulimonadaceae bacterium]
MTTQLDNLYERLLISWCDRMLKLQVHGMDLPEADGGIFCPACARIHGRCADAVYPLLAAAKLTGDHGYVDAAVKLLDWSKHVTQLDGSFTNEPTTNDWRGITVFSQIALGEALHHHGDLLDDATRDRWMQRFRAASDFLLHFLTMDMGNINYPASIPAAMALAYDLLGDEKYAIHADKRASECMVYLSENDRLLYGEHYRRGRGDTTPKGARAVDIGYNVEETLPNLALYAMLRGNSAVMDNVLKSAQAHLELMLPDGAWDNSFGVRNTKWTYWGSRTSDGCQTLCAALAPLDARFITASRRNTELLERCTHDGLLYGGPHYAEHGEPPCVHHTFCHAKAIAAAIDLGLAAYEDAAPPLPRETAQGIRQFSDIDTYLVASGPWRATITGYDWIAPPGGHATGGALSMLWHSNAGPILAASMEHYQRTEPDNMQLLRNIPDIPLIPRLEFFEEGQAYRSCNDPAAVIIVDTHDGEIAVRSEGRLVTRNGSAPISGEIIYTQTVRFDGSCVGITVSYKGSIVQEASFVLPIISPRSERSLESEGGLEFTVRRPDCSVVIVASVKTSVALPGIDRIFQHVPGFEAIPLTYAMLPGEPLNLSIRVV